jgi:hypothetical protein
MVPGHPNMTRLANNTEATLMGCSTKDFGKLPARKLRLRYSDGGEEIIVVASRDLQSCLKKGITVGPRSRFAAQRIWETKAVGTEAEVGGGYIEEQMED